MRWSLLRSGGRSRRRRGARWPMDLSRLEELKRRLVHEKDFMGVWGFFLDEFATDMAFIDLGEAVRDETLEATIHHVAAQMFPRPAMAIMVRLIRLADR